jgi:outer membrane protein assembly factor BamE (lipoprotein component of BamABCDE complex)
MRILNFTRLFIAAGCICLSACAGSLEQVVSTDPEEKNQQPNQPTIHDGACAKLSELKIGMTTQQVISACGQRPIRTSDFIAKDAKKVEVWIYANRNVAHRPTLGGLA